MNRPSFLEKILWIRPGQGVAAAGRIPQEAEFFKDHFPAFPILPGVLALEILKQTAETYLHSQSPPVTGPHFVSRIRGTKFSTYLKPGDEWESRMELIAEEGGQSHWNGRLLHHGRPAVSSYMTLKPIRTLLPTWLAFLFLAWPGWIAS